MIYKGNEFKSSNEAAKTGKNSARDGRNGRWRNLDYKWYIYYKLRGWKRFDKYAKKRASKKQSGFYVRNKEKGLLTTQIKNRTRSQERKSS